MESVRRKLLTNPRETASSLSVLLFTWTIDLFKKGYQQTLQLGDLYQTLPEDRSTTLGDQLESNWVLQKNNESRPSLVKALVRTFWKKFLVLGFICFFNDILIRLTQPYLLGQLLLFFRKNSTVTFTEALWTAIAMVTLNALNIMTVNQYFIGCFHAGMKVRVAMCSLIYRKTLKLSQAAVRENAIVNLLSNDVNRFDLISVLLHFMWSAPLMAIIITYILWREARWAGMIGLAIVFFIVTLQSCVGKLSSIFRLKTALRTDTRIKFMEEIINGVRVIKMFAWETPFGKMIDSARKKELNILRKNTYVRCLYMTFALFTTRMAIFCTMLSISLLYGSENITATKIFVISAYFQLITQTLSQMFVRGVAEIAEAFVSVKRLQNFLLSEEMNGMIKNEKPATEDNVDNVISIVNLTANWPAAKEKNSKSKKVSDLEVEELSLKRHEQTTEQQDTLCKINVNVRQGSLVGIVGPVGSGKSSFLQALLRELPANSGTVEANGSISYACQEPWIFSASVRQNIIFSNPFDELRYDTVIRSCALDVDIENFESGDMLVIGDRGISLSGGQKARINLARCVYRKSDIYLFDDPLSAVDANVARHLFSECIGPNGFLAKNGSTRILVTHQVHFLKEADVVIVLRNGKVDFHGSPAELMNKGIDFSEFLKVEVGEERSEDDGKVVQPITTAVVKELNVSGEEKVAELEDTSKNKSKDSTFKTYFLSGTNVYVLGVVFTLFIAAQLLASGCDFWVAFW
ncbi:hypothetical protein HA402_011460 [Bradysia odoriphaga]|nr:hypothetical protein HA402_011460 [Bradysia odoriphaga]